MSELKIIEAAKSGDTETLGSLLAEGADVDERDEQGWTPLCWAAGRGDAGMVEALLERGADVTAVGRDLRRPSRIAKAAGHQTVVEMLTEAEKRQGVWEDPRLTRPYCKAYLLRDLRRFSGWSEPSGEEKQDVEEDVEEEASGIPLSDESIVYLHHDFTVTRSIWQGEDVLFEEVTPEWQTFCTSELGFALPEDLL